MTQSSATKSARAAGGDTAEEGAGGDSISLVSQVTGHVRSREPPQFERAVVSRTRFHISLPASTPPSGAGKPSAASEVDQRGWSSPHGEPYRPLGRPELNLKFSPQLVYGVTPMMQNAHRVQGGSGVGGATGTGNSDKDKELREPSSCTTSGASITTLADQFVASLTSRKRPLDDRQIKLAHRLQANAGGFSPEKVRGIYRRKPDEDPIDATGEQPHLYQTSRADASLQLLREAIEEGTSRLRSTRNGTNFLQKLPPSDLSGFQALHEQYLRARLKTPHSVVSSGSVGGSTQLFQVILYLHHDDLELLQVKQLLVFLRNALRIDHDEWTSFFASHGLAQPTDDFAGE
ncbi:hypothetical protein KRP22_008164 [Phytophthora ramorum]|nr:hypothetical protein KRP22_3825 [Phytophthora ramorum]